METYVRKRRPAAEKVLFERREDLKEAPFPQKHRWARIKKVSLENEEV